MKRYVLPCICSARVPVTAGQAGDQVRCPRCGTDLPVPRLGELARLAEIAVGDGDGAPPRHAVRPWTAGHACLLAGIVIAVLAAAAATIVQSTRTAAIDEAMIRRAVRAEEIVAIHQAWESFARQGVERPLIPAEAQLLRRAAGAVAVGRLLWAIAASGTLLAISGGYAVARGCRT
jgi:hypothetical protein